MEIILLFFSALFFAYLLEPLCSKAETICNSRAIASFLSILFALLVFTILVSVILPLFESEFQKLRERLPLMISVAHGHLMNQLIELNLSFQVDLIEELKGKVLEFISKFKEKISGYVIGFLLGGTNIILDFLGWLIIVPVTVFYLLKDWHRIFFNFRKIIPSKLKNITAAVAEETDKKLKLYLKGQFYTICAMATFYSVALLIAGYENWVSIGILSGVLLILPYIGFVISMIIALLAGILDLGFAHGTLATLVVFFIGQFIEGFLLTPKFVGESVGLHPLAVIFSLLIFGSILGFTGLLIAIPITAIFSSLSAQALRSDRP